MFFRPRCICIRRYHQSLFYSSFLPFLFPLPTNKSIRGEYERMKVHMEFANIARTISRGQIGGGGCEGYNRNGILLEKARLEGWGA